MSTHNLFTRHGSNKLAAVRSSKLLFFVCVCFFFFLFVLLARLYEITGRAIAVTLASAFVSAFTLLKC